MADMLNSTSEKSVSASVVPRQYLYPFALVTSLFALWGFANDITNPLVKAFKEIFLISNQQSSLVQTAFYGGYATMAIPAALVIRKFSYKTGILLGLTLYAVGALLFIPASSSMSFYLFLVALYILTFGLAFLETSANPYILSMGPSETATRRLTLAQAFNPIGSLVGMIVASNMVLAGLQVGEFRDQQIKAHSEYANMLPSEVDEKVTEALQEFSETSPQEHQAMQAHDLGVVRLPYVVIAMVVIAVLVVFLVSKMPDTGLEEDPIHVFAVLSRLASFRYIGGVTAQMFYVGAQIMCWTFIIHYGVLVLGMTAPAAQQWNIAAMCTFLTGCWLGTMLLLKYVEPSKALSGLALGAAVATAAAIYLPGLAGMISIVVISLFMSVMFPTIYSLALDGLTPNDAKLGSAGLIFAIVGGALMPLLQGGIIDTGNLSLGLGLLSESLSNVIVIPMQSIHPENVRASFLLPLVCFVVIGVYGLIVTKHAKQQRTHRIENGSGAAAFPP